MSERRRGLRALGQALLDPVAIAAVIAALGGIAAVVAPLMQNNAFERVEKQCDRAFAFLQDESLGPRLQDDGAFHRLQRSVAVRCSKGKAD